MSVNRINKVNETMLRELTAQIRTVKDPRLSGAIISVIRVDVAHDLRTAKAYVSVLGGNETEVLAGLKSAAGFIGRGLGQNIKLHHTPKIDFYLDKSISHGANINKILEQLAPKEQQDENNNSTDRSDAARR